MEHIIGIKKINLNEDKNFEYILILKNNGLFNLYEIKNETKKMNEFNENIFEIDSLENMTNSHNNINFFIPKFAFYIKNYENLLFTSVKLIDNYIFLSGNFNIIYFNINDFKELINNKTIKNNNNQFNNIEIIYFKPKIIKKLLENTNELLINNINFFNNYIIAYSKYGNIFIFDKNNKHLQYKFLINNKISNEYYLKILSFIDDKNLIYGDNYGCLYFLEIINSEIKYKNIFFDVSRNKTFNINDNISLLKNKYIISNIIVQNNYYIVSCNNFILIIDKILIICTNIIPFNSYINILYKYENRIFIGKDDNLISEFRNKNSKLKSKFNSSITSIFISENNKIYFGGNSNIIEVYELTNNIYNLYNLYI